MAETEVLDILRQALWTALIISTPILAVALVVGLAIGLVQALTSIIEPLMMIGVGLMVGVIIIAMYLPMFKMLTDRKSTRLNSSHTVISYAVFCLKKKK